MNKCKLKQKLFNIASKLPCELCYLKGGTNIESDGSCRHKPVLSSDEVVSRIFKLLDS